MLSTASSRSARTANCCALRPSRRPPGRRATYLCGRAPETRWRRPSGFLPRPSGYRGTGIAFAPPAEDVYAVRADGNDTADRQRAHRAATVECVRCRAPAELVLGKEIARPGTRFDEQRASPSRRQRTRPPPSSTARALTVDLSTIDVTESAAERPEQPSSRTLAARRAGCNATVGRVATDWAARASSTSTPVRRSIRRSTGVPTPRFLSASAFQAW